MVAGQFFGDGAEPRIQVWVELVATTRWWLWALRRLAQADSVPWPRWWRQRRLTPGALRRLAPALLFKVGLRTPQPQRRGKSPGRPRGMRLEPRPRYKIYRKRVARRE